MSEFLIDTSIWIEFFRGREAVVQDFLLPLIDRDKIHYDGIILGELLVGAFSQREYNFIKENFEGFKHLETDKGTFEEAGRIGCKLRRKGISVPITDLIIAAHSLKKNLVLATTDPHFQLMKKFFPLKLSSLPL